MSGADTDVEAEIEIDQDIFNYDVYARNLADQLKSFVQLNENHVNITLTADAPSTFRIKVRNHPPIEKELRWKTIKECHILDIEDPEGGFETLMNNFDVFRRRVVDGLLYRLACKICKKSEDYGLGDGIWWENQTECKYFNKLKEVLEAKDICCILDSTGSLCTSTKSDYDLNIAGTIHSHTIIDLFTDVLNHVFHGTSNDIFDTNLYASTFVIADDRKCIDSMASFWDWTNKTYTMNGHEYQFKIPMTDDPSIAQIQRFYAIMQFQKISVTKGFGSKVSITFPSTITNFWEANALKMTDPNAMATAYQGAMFTLETSSSYPMHELLPLIANANLYAEESYFSKGALIHVVGTMVKFPKITVDQKLEILILSDLVDSMIENCAYFLEHFKTTEPRLDDPYPQNTKIVYEAKLVTACKYLWRFFDASLLYELKKKQLGMAFNPVRLHFYKKVIAILTIMKNHVRGQNKTGLEEYLNRIRDLNPAILPKDFDITVFTTLKGANIIDYDLPKMEINELIEIYNLGLTKILPPELFQANGPIQVVNFHETMDNLRSAIVSMLAHECRLFDKRLMQDLMDLSRIRSIVFEILQETNDENGTITNNFVSNMNNLTITLTTLFEGGGKSRKRNSKKYKLKKRLLKQSRKQKQKQKQRQKYHLVKSSKKKSWLRSVKSM